MFRKTSGAILCPSCGRLTNADAPACLVCGRRNPGMWGFAGPLRALFRRRSFVDIVTVACIVLYVASLVFDPRAALQPRGLFNIFSPSIDALFALGAAGSVPWQLGRWWTLLTAIYLHGGLLHILFNVLWIRQLGPAVEELYGPSRLVVIFTVAGAAGFVASNLLGHAFTIGASGSIFGLLGAMVAFGQKRGGTFGTMVLRQYGQWALLLFVLGFLMPGVNNIAHAGGFVGGFVAGLVLALAERRAETGFDQLMAAACIGATLLGFGLAVWSTLVA
jgi:rhomboid protease GluP